MKCKLTDFLCEWDIQHQVRRHPPKLIGSCIWSGPLEHDVRNQANDPCRQEREEVSPLRPVVWQVGDYEEQSCKSDDQLPICVRIERECCCQNSTIAGTRVAFAVFHITEKEDCESRDCIHRLKRGPAMQEPRRDDGEPERDCPPGPCVNSVPGEECGCQNAEDGKHCGRPSRDFNRRAEKGR